MLAVRASVEENTNRGAVAGRDWESEAKGRDQRSERETTGVST